MKNRKKGLSVTLVLTLALSLAMPGLSAFAETAEGQSTSEEVIYATLKPDGEVKNAYAVVILDAKQAGTVSHYGSYERVKNLTDGGELEYDGGKVRAKVGADSFYYQGDIKKPVLPWDVKISYKLDGREIDAAELGGKTGRLEINIKTLENKTVNEAFFDSYMLQATVTLDTELCKNITASGASLASAGANKLATFMVLPGMQGDMTLEADVKDFEMAGISIAAVPYDVGGAMGDISKLTDGLDSLTAGVSQLSAGSSKLSTGVAELSTGAKTLENGTKSYGEGLAKLSANSQGLLAASDQINAALGQIAAGLSGDMGGADLSALTQLPAALKQLAAGLEQTSAALEQLSKGYAAAFAAMNSAVSAIPAPSVSEADIAALMEANPGNAALSALAANYSAAQAVRAAWQQTSQAFAAVNEGLPALRGSVDAVAEAQRSMALEIETAISGSESLSGLSSLVSAISSLEASYGGFHEGLRAYTGGVTALSAGWRDVQTGVSGFAAGTGALNNGARELSNGASVLNKEVQSIPAQVDDMLGGGHKADFAPVSFLSDKNEDCRSVQFVICTESIERPEPIEEEQPAPEENSFWEKIKALFS